MQQAPAKMPSSVAYHELYRSQGVNSSSTVGEARRLVLRQREEVGSLEFGKFNRQCHAAVEAALAGKAFESLAENADTAAPIKPTGMDQPVPQLLLSNRDRPAAEKVRVYVRYIGDNFLLHAAALCVSLAGCVATAAADLTPKVTQETLGVVLLALMTVDISVTILLRFVVHEGQTAWPWEGRAGLPSKRHVSAGSSWAVELAVQCAGVALALWRFPFAPLHLLKPVAYAVNRHRLLFSLRCFVARNKRLWDRDGSQLDLTYITDRVIALGLPAVGLESIYRNDIEDIATFLRVYHPAAHMLVNTCCERRYHTGYFHRVSVFPCADHQVMPLARMFLFCQLSAEFLRSCKKRAAVLAVHCKGGKGRTGLMVCCWLLYSRMCATPEEAMKAYARRRTDPLLPGPVQTVGNACQIRYVTYFHALMWGRWFGLPTWQDAQVQEEINRFAEIMEKKREVKVPYVPPPLKMPPSVRMRMLRLAVGVSGPSLRAQDIQVRVTRLLPPANNLHVPRSSNFWDFSHPADSGIFYDYGDDPVILGDAALPQGDSGKSGSTDFWESDNGTTFMDWKLTLDNNHDVSTFLAKMPSEASRQNLRPLRLDKFTKCGETRPLNEYSPVILTDDFVIELCVKQKAFARLWLHCGFLHVTSRQQVSYCRNGEGDRNDGSEPPTGVTCVFTKKDFDYTGGIYRKWRLKKHKLWIAADFQRWLSW